MTDIETAVGLLKVAKCPNCDGNGVAFVEGYTIEHGCCGLILPDGSCCGLAVPVQVPTQEPQQCQWCDEQKELIAKYDTLEV